MEPTGTVRYRVPAYPDPSALKERTGAGDAFASAMVAAPVQGRPMLETLAWGPINAMSVVQEVGSQTGLLTGKALLEPLRSAPQSYAVVTWWALRHRLLSLGGRRRGVGGDRTVRLSAASLRRAAGQERPLSQAWRREAAVSDPHTG